jgi:hypothetical protein
MDAPDLTPYEHKRDLAFLDRVRRASLDELSAIWGELYAAGEPEPWQQEALARAFARLSARDVGARG